MMRWMALGETNPDIEFDNRNEQAFQPIVSAGKVASFEELEPTNAASHTTAPQQPSLKEGQVRTFAGRNDTYKDDASAAIIATLRDEADRLRAALVDQELELKLAFEERTLDLETQQAHLMHEQLEDMRSAIVDFLSAKTAEVLKPVLSSAFLEATLAQYRMLLSEFMASEQILSIKIKGPEKLVNAIKDLAGDNPEVAFHPGPASEISLEIGNAVITSKLTAWAGTLYGVREIE